jgi:hypothetical protein
MAVSYKNIWPTYTGHLETMINEKCGIDKRVTSLYLKLLKYEWSIFEATYSNWKNKCTFTTIILIPPHYGINHGKETIKFYSR